MTLYDDSDTATLTDGRTVRLRIEPDQDTDIQDYEAYGSVAWVRPHPYRVGHDQRPEGFDGNAEKLWTCENGSECFWWQPPTDLVHGRGTPEFASLRQLVRELVTWGFKSVGVEVLDGTDAYDRPIVVDAAWIGGVDSVDDGYLAELVSDLLGELDVTLADDAA